MLEGLGRNRLVSVTILSLNLPTVHRQISQRETRREIVACVSRINAQSRETIEFEKPLELSCCPGLPDCVPAGVK